MSAAVGRVDDRVTAGAVEVVVEALVNASDRQSRALLLAAVTRAMCDSAAWMHDPHGSLDEVVVLMEIAALAEAHQVAVSEAPLGTHLHPFAPEPPRSPSVDPDVSAVVLRAQQGDTAAFERLVRAHEGELGRLALRMLRDHGEAEDVVQDVFVQAWRRLDHLDDPDAFHGWLYQITTRACLDALRARSRRPLDLTDGSGAAFDASALALDGRRGEGPQDAAQTSAHLRGLAIALADLAPDLRTCWVLKQLHGLSYADIAFATGVPVSTVRGRLVRAREGVRGRMADWR